VVVDVDQVDVAGDIELPGAQLAHAHNAQLRPFATGGKGRAVALVQGLAAFVKADVKCPLCQFSHGQGHQFQRCVGVAVQTGQALQHQLACGAQGLRNVSTCAAQCVKDGLHGCACGSAGGQKGELFCIPAANALDET